MEILSRVSSGPMGEPLKAAAFSINAGFTPSASINWPWVIVWPITRVVKKPGESLTTMGFLPSFWDRSKALASAVIAGLVTGDDFYQRHSLRRREEMHADEVFRARRGLRQLSDRQG